jgi:hypothetical protein
MNPEADLAMQTLRKTILPSDDIHPMGYLLPEGIQHWIKHPDLPFKPDTHSYPPHLKAHIQKALLSQERIGWNNCLKGFMSLEWSNLAKLDMISPSKDEHGKGAHHIRTIITAIHTFTRNIWLVRNKALHEVEEINATTTATTAEQIEISYYHTRPNLLRFDDRHLCDRNLNQLLTGSSSTRRQWLRLVKSSVQTHAIDGKRQTTIQSFFPSVQ